jgi:hypothetical protein
MIPPKNTFNHFDIDSLFNIVTAKKKNDYKSLRTLRIISSDPSTSKDKVTAIPIENEDESFSKYLDYVIKCNDFETGEEQTAFATIGEYLYSLSTHSDTGRSYN